MKTTVHEIRQRLLFLLVRAFIIVVFLSLLFFTFIVGYFLTSSSTPIPFPFISTLEGYYLGKGNWDSVDVVFDSMVDFDKVGSLLVDKDYRLVLDRRFGSATETSATLQLGDVYEVQPQDVVFRLSVHNELIGYFIVAPNTFAERLGFARAIIFPIGIISFVLAIFLVIVATLLIQRFINPLADVIYAAREVSTGKLNTRIETRGPQDLRTLSASFNEMASSLERNDRERREMLADVAHELRTPLSVIRGRLEGIVDGVYQENGSQVSTALEQTYILERLIDDLRLLTLAETRQLQFDKSSVNIELLIQRVIDMFSAESGEKNISLSFSEKNGNLFSMVDPQRFEQVMSNLIGNALRYSNEGGKVWVTANEISDGLSITVNDNGAGIPEEDLPFIFDRFWRKDKSRSRTSGGTRLGLAIAKQLIEAQGGTITAKNLVEGGLQIVLQFPNRLTPSNAAVL